MEGIAKRILKGECGKGTMGSGVGLGSVRDEGAAEKESRWGHTARCTTKQTKQTENSKQANKKHKPPQGREVAQWYSACPGPGYHPSTIKRERQRERQSSQWSITPKASTGYSSLTSISIYQQLIPLLNKYQVLGFILKCKGSRQDRSPAEGSGS